MAIRYRRNINCLSADQLHDLRESYQTLYDMPEAAPESFATLGGLHGLPSPSWCDHGAPGFLTWHRAYMRAFEKALQCVNSDVMLPFWDWSSGPTTGLPAACASPTYVNRVGDTVPNPLFSGPIATAAGGGVTNRRADIATTSFAGPAMSAQAALGSATYDSFQDALNGPHGSVHGLTGGHMGTVPRAGFDPIFFLHHCNVDRLWWNWQQSHPAVAMPADEATYDLDPFNKPYTTSWLKGADVDSTDDLGYRYRNWCFWLPPFLIWEVVVVKFDPPMTRRMRNARLVLRSNRMAAESIEFRVFINDAEASHHTPVDADTFAGSIATFGMGEMAMDGHGKHDEHAEHGHADRRHGVIASTSSRFDLELNLTDQLRHHCGHGEHDDNDGVDQFTIKIVAVDTEGNPIDPDRVGVDDIELIID